MAATLEGADPAFAESVNRFLAEQNRTLSSGVRTYEEQANLYAMKGPKYAAAPGHSNHERGTAADINGIEKISDDVLAQYGLYRPMSWELWHVEPIGNRSGMKNKSTPPVSRTTHKVVEQMEKAFSAMGIVDIGEQGTGVGEAVTSVGEQITGVGDQAQGSVPATKQDDHAHGTDPMMGAGAMSMGTASGSAYDDLFNTYGTQYGIDPKLLQEVARAESGFNPNAKSGAGATGLMQFMPGTAKGLGIDPTDPAQAVEGAARLLSQYIKNYGGSVEKALAAYNAGPGAVEEYGGVPPYKETQNYVKKIMGSYGG